MDSAIDVTSPDKSEPSAAAPQTLDRRPRSPLRIGGYHRDGSPNKGGKWNPPPARPEIEEGLRESLNRELQGHDSQQVEAEAQPPAQGHSQTHDQTQAENLAQAHQQSSPPPNHVRSQPSSERISPPSDLNGQQHNYPYSPDQHSFDPKKRKRHFSNRTKTGCHTCRGRKKKCDEGKPTCQNCTRGGFVCGGYGPKQPGFKPTVVSGRAPVTLQAKANYEPSQGPTGYYQNTVEETGRSFSHWGRIPQESETHPSPVNPRQADHRKSWWTDPGTAWQAHEVGSLPFPQGRLPPTEPPSMPPLHAYQHGSHPPPPPHAAPSLDSWVPAHHPSDPYRPTTGVGTMVSSRESRSTSSSQRTAVLALAYNGGAYLSEKEKMLIGRPFLHFIDDVLLNDREQCKGALERYNDAALTSKHISPEERGRFFRAIVDPEARRNYTGYGRGRDEPYDGPKGTVGSGVIVESPFHCEYGYNVHIGDQVVIQAGCVMQDACEIHIGNRTLIGPNVKFYGITASVDPSQRKGSHGHVTAGAIKIGDDCFIGGDVIILPYRKIGNGAVVGAGSVVTKDVKENTVVAGNPAKVIRRIDPGDPNIDRHHPDIQDQNDKMLQEMRDVAIHRDG